MKIVPVGIIAAMCAIGVVGIAIIAAGLDSVDTSSNDDDNGVQKVSNTQESSDEKRLSEFTEQDIMDLEEMMFQLTNQKRTINNVSILKWDVALADIARNHSQDMKENDFFNHVNLDELNSIQRGELADYECSKGNDNVNLPDGIPDSLLEPDGISENISLGMPDPNIQYRLSDLSNAIIESLTETPEHKTIFLNPLKDKIGIGVSVNATHIYTTQNFC